MKKLLIFTLLMILLVGMVNAVEYTEKHGVSQASTDAATNMIGFNIKSNEGVTITGFRNQLSDGTTKCGMFDKVTKLNLGGGNCTVLASKYCVLPVPVETVANSEYYITCSGGSHRYAVAGVPIDSGNFTWVNGVQYIGGNWNTIGGNYYSIEYINFTISIPVKPINITAANPLNNTQFNTNPISFNVSVNATNDFNARLYINGTLNETKSYSSGSEVIVDFSKTMLDGNWLYYISLNDSSVTVNSTTNKFYVDTSSPIITDTFVNESRYLNNNISFNANFTDEQNLFSYNISIDGVSQQGQTNINARSLNVTFTQDSSLYSAGLHNLSIRVADGHTAQTLLSKYKFTNGLFNEYAKYEFNAPYKYGQIKIKQKDSSILDNWQSEELKDRYQFKFKPKNKKSTYTFEIEAESYIHIIQNEDTKYKKWLVYEDHWLDFMPYEDIYIIRIDDNKVEVTINNVDPNQEELIFNSIGDLNIVTKEYVFGVMGLTETFESVIFSDYTTEYNLSINLIALTNLSITPNAILQFNNTNYSATLQTFNSSLAEFDITLTVPDVVNKETKQHKWYFNLTTLSPTIIDTNLTNQTVYDINVSECSGNTIFPIANFTYYDEITNNIINTTNAYLTTIYDGTAYYNQTGTFPRNTTNKFCTNIDPSDVSYSWSMWRAFSLSEPSYITRIVSIAEAGAYTLNNINVAEIPFYMIGTLNSSTVTYTWLTTQFQRVDGTMRIYQCNGDGTKDLIESTPITSGTAVANIELLTQPYSYDVIINGLIYEDTSYTTCHVESSTERTYYVDIVPITVVEPIGLYSTSCSIAKSGNSTVLMQWGTNAESEAPITGCIKAYRRSIHGEVLIYENCTNASSSLERSIPNSGFDYVVKGDITQRIITVPCEDVVTFIADNDTAKTFGISGLFAIFILIGALGLLYAGDGEIQLLGAAVGIIAAWVLGIMNFSWEVVSAMIAFLLFLTIIGRYTRK